MAVKWNAITDKTTVHTLYPGCELCDNDKFNYTIKEFYAFDKWGYPAGIYDIVKFLHGSNHYNNVGKDFDYDLKNEKCRPPYDDHGRIYYYSPNKQRAYIYHPYRDFTKIKEELWEWAKKYDLRVHLVPNFYGEGTCGIIIDAYD